MPGRGYFTGGLVLTLFLLCAGESFSAEYENGRIKLVLSEETGRFSLYYMADLDSGIFEPLFADQDPRTGFLAVQVNDRSFKMGEAASFRTRLGGSTDEPAIIFDSPGITVTQKFTFISVGNSPYANGISVAVYILNKGERPVRAGIRLLLDTFLGEEAGGSGPSFTTDLRPLMSETLLNANAPDEWWVSRNARYGLMGTLNSVYVQPPSTVHFANWKRLSSAAWALQFSPRNFSSPPSSFNDAAVSYIYDPETIEAKSFRVVELLLAAEEAGGFAEVDFFVVPAFLARNSRGDSDAMPSWEENVRTDQTILRDLVARVDDLMARGEPVPEEMLAEMEILVIRVRDRYGIW
ncbi:MAG: hypothetical protein LBQ35_00845 [Spirochaetaceae bacterium]|jgi:hypothetical protein|nr:hypothetical protein [Spirochaetaceae bacterium]